MKKYFLIFLASASLFVSIPNIVLASDPDIVVQIAHDSGYASAYDTTLSQTVGKIIRIILGLLGIIFLGLTVYAGALWMTAAGEEEKVTKATGILKTAVIGLIIILGSYSLSYFVLDKILEATL
jgi:hypothetical protein